MENFLKKLARYDGSAYLKQSLAQDSFEKTLQEARALIRSTGASVARIRAKKPIWEYLVSPEGQKEFEFIKSLADHKSKLASLSAGAKKQQISKITEDWLQKSINRVSAAMGDALTELSIESSSAGAQKLFDKVAEFEKLEKELSARIEGAKVPGATLQASPKEIKTKTLSSAPSVKTDLNEKLRAELSTIEDTDEIVRIFKKRLNQIEYQEIPDYLKDKLIDEAREILREALRRVMRKAPPSKREDIENPLTRGMFDPVGDQLKQYFPGNQPADPLAPKYDIWQPPTPKEEEKSPTFDTLKWRETGRKF